MGLDFPLGRVEQLVLGGILKREAEARHLTIAEYLTEFTDAYDITKDVHIPILAKKVEAIADHFAFCMSERKPHFKPTDPSAV